MYYKKVEITGISTGNLPVINDVQRTELIKKMKTGDKKAKDTLVLANLKLVLSIIQKINSRNIDRDDLFQVGCIGLIKALNNFDPGLNIQFSTYGVVMIAGEIKRYIRDNSSLKITRSTKDLAFKALSYKEQFIKENDCEPTISQIASGLNTTTYKISSAMEAISPALSLYEPTYSDDNESYLLDMISGENFEDSFSTKLIIQEIFHNLKKREKQIMNLRFIQGKTQTEVADMIGISQAQVSRIEKNVLSTVKKELNY